MVYKNLLNRSLISLLFISSYIFIYIYNFDYIFYLIVLIFILILLEIYLYFNKYRTLIYFYLCLSFIFLLNIDFSNNNYFKFNLMVIVIVLFDIFSYLIGKMIGKNKILSVISPNKTLEGLIGGFIFSFLISYIYLLFINYEINYSIIFFIISIIFSSFLGDVFESIFKRLNNLKNSSNFLFSHGGTYHKTMLQEEKKTWDGFDFTKEKRDEIVAYLQSRWSGENDWISFSKKFSEDQESKKSYKASGKYDASILMLTNVMWDAQLHYPANAFPSMLEWIISTIKFFKLKPNLELIIRVHPAEISGTLPSRQLVVNEIEKHYKILPSNIKIIGPDDPSNTYKLAKKCDTALIYGTKTGVELAAMGIPTIVAGEAWIRGKGLTIDVDTPSAYELALSKLPLRNRMSPEIQERALKYAYHFFFRRMITLNCVKKTKGHETFDYAFDSIDDLRPGSDKGLDVICDGIMSGDAYVYNT